MQKSFSYDLPSPKFDGKTIVKKAWANVPAEIYADEKAGIIEEIKRILSATNTVLVAHYYVDGDIQDLALATGGCVSDSLEMARFGRECRAERLIVAGVRFMGETAKILSPEKTILMPDINATCSLDLGCPAESLAEFRSQYPDHQLVVYANTSAEVKAIADWMVTSSCALPIVNHLKNAGKKILWAPDRHLGRYIRDETNADMILWDGACIVHDEFKGDELKALKLKHPKAMVLVHPESPKSVVAQADMVGSTSAILKAAIESNANTYIVATEQGMLHQMRRLAPNKNFIAAPTAGKSATCKSCAFCPWMAMNDLNGILQSLKNNTGQVHITNNIIDKAKICIDRMLDFTAGGSQIANIKSMATHIPNIGIA